MEEGSETGFDFKFDGCNSFLATHGPGFGRARWKSVHELVIVTSEIGSDKTHECTLKVTERNFIYYRKDGVLQTKPKKP